MISFPEDVETIAINVRLVVAEVVRQYQCGQRPLLVSEYQLVTLMKWTDNILGGEKS